MKRWLLAAAIGLCATPGLAKDTGLIFISLERGNEIVVLNPDAAPGVDFLRKSSMQLASKMRFVSAQLLALLTDDLWLRNASHANAIRLIATVAQNTTWNARLRDLCRNSRCASSAPGQPQASPIMCSVLSGVRRHPAFPATSLSNPYIRYEAQLNSR